MRVPSVYSVLVWSRWLRLAHWSLAVSIFGLLFSGWLLSNDPILFASAIDFHYIFTAIMLPALILRIYLLLFGRGTDNLRDCELDLHRINQAFQTIRFYLTFGKISLPKWYAHNPLWGPIYLFLFFFLILCSLSGFALSYDRLYLANINMLDLHRLSYYSIAGFVLLHLPAVFSHDLSGKCSDVSAMINGNRIFTIEESSIHSQNNVQTVSLDDLLKSNTKKPQDT